MNNKIVLLVEDNEDDVMLTKRALNKGNIMNEVVVARDGAEALDYLFGPHRNTESLTLEFPALVLLDLNLPKIGGLEVLRRIRADDRTKRLPVVVLTSSKEEQDIIKSYDLGVNSYVRKPINFDVFIEAAQQLGLYWLLLNEIPTKSSQRIQQAG